MPASPPASVDRIPSEFLYWDNIARPGARALRLALRATFGWDPALPDHLIRAWAHGYYDADPVGEAFVDSVSIPMGQAAGQAMLARALREGVRAVPDAPASLRTLFQQVETDPPWLVWDQVETGARVFRRWGTDLFSFAGAITLHGYRESSVAMPLVLTGGYIGDTASRRFLETAAFWFDIAQPGGLRHGGAGRATALRVRLMHVYVRRLLLSHSRWRLAAWGVPISQADALLTLMGGSLLPAYGLRALGYRTSPDELAALLHFWRYVGHLLGVQPRWYPRDLRQAVGLMFTAEVKGARRSGDDGRLLARSYLASWAPPRSDDRWARRLEYWRQHGFIGLFVPLESRCHFGLPSALPWSLLLLGQAPATFARETLRRRSPRVEAWCDRRAIRATHRWLAERMGPERAAYRAPERLGG